MKKSFFSLSLLLTLAIPSSAQQEPIRCTLGYNGGIGYRFLVGDEGLIETWNEIYRPLVVQGLDFRLDIPLNRRLSAIVGVGFQSYGYQLDINRTETSFPDEIDPYYGFVYQTKEDWESYTFINRYYHNYLVIPALIRWRVLNMQKSSIDLNSGFSTNIFLYGKQRNIRTSESGEKSKSQNDYVPPTRNLVVSGTIGINYCFEISEKINISFGPKFDVFLMNMYTAEDIKTFPYNGSIYFGVGF